MTVKGTEIGDGEQVSKILNDPALFAEWKRDISTMAQRIISTRHELYRLLTEKYKTPGDWKHITVQIGMFSFTGLNEEQSKKMVENAHIYMTNNGEFREDFPSLGFLWVVRSEEY